MWGKVSAALDQTTKDILDKLRPQEIQAHLPYQCLSSYGIDALCHAAFMHELAGTAAASTQEERARLVAVLFAAFGIKLTPIPYQPVDGNVHGEWETHKGVYIPASRTAPVHYFSMDYRNAFITTQDRIAGEFDAAGVKQLLTKEWSIDDFFSQVLIAEGGRFSQALWQATLRQVQYLRGPTKENAASMRFTEATSRLTDYYSAVMEELKLT